MKNHRPKVPSPAPEEAWTLGFYENEAQEYAAIIRKPYEQLNNLDCGWIANEAVVFLPPSHIRYFAPALLAHGTNRSELDLLYLPHLIGTLHKAQPFEDSTELVEQIVQIVHGFSPWRFSLPPWPSMAWHDENHFDLLGGRFFRLALDLGPSEEHLDRFLLADTGPLAMATVELAFGVFEEKWPLPANSPRIQFLPESLTRIAAGPDPHASLGARFVLGEDVPLAGCSDPACKTHGHPTRGRN